MSRVTPWTCWTCGSVFHDHRCHGPLADVCACGHWRGSHHASERGNILYCTVWSPGQCPCKRYREA